MATDEKDKLREAQVGNQPSDGTAQSRTISPLSNPRGDSVPTTGDTNSTGSAADKPSDA